MSAAAVTRTGRGRSAKSLVMIEAMRRILEKIQPTSVRSVCYQLFNAKLIDSMAKANTNAAGRLLRQAREDGLIPWEWVVDESREAERASLWRDPDQIIDAAVRGYRRDYWQDQPVHIEVWSEKGTVRGTLAPVLDAYGTTFRVMHGFASATVMNDVAALTRRSGKPCVFLYVGDYDPSGLYMSEADLPTRLARYGGDAEIRRIALTADDVGDCLPSFPASDKSLDKRYDWFTRSFGRRCWELDAMKPNDLRERVERHIVHLIDRDAWDHACTIERAQTESLRTFQEAWRGKLMQASKYGGAA